VWRPSCHFFPTNQELVQIGKFLSAKLEKSVAFLFFNNIFPFVVPIWRLKMADSVTALKPKKAKNEGGKREKFVQLAEKRTINAIKAIRVLAKLGNKHAYEYTDADVKRIASTLSKEVDALKARMLSSGGKEAVEFTL
jgi:hypothetical protein